MAVESETHPLPESGEYPALPTSLHLFHFRETKASEIKPTIESANHLGRNLAAVARFNEQFALECNARFERLGAIITDLNALRRELYSSQAASQAYLEMEDELSQRGLSPQETMDFYSICLEANTRYSTFVYQLGKKAFNNRLVHSQRFSSFIEELSGEPPQWFGHNLQAWRNFVGIRANFTLYLNPDLKKYGQNIPMTAGVGRIGGTFRNALPDWLTERGNELPDRQMVEEELKEDTEEARLTNQSIGQTKKHFNYTREGAERKLVRVMNWSMQEAEKLFSENGDFCYFLIYLKLTSNTPALNIPESYLQDVPRLIKFANKSMLGSPEKGREQIIRNYMEEEDKATCEEFIALWIENQLKEGGIITSSGEVIDERKAQLFDLLFAQVGNVSGQTDSAWTKLQVENPNLFSSLQYNIKPFIALVSSEEINYLREFVSVSQGKESVETLIWEMADCISRNCDGIGELAATDKPLSRTLEKYWAFTSRWLRRNWQWAYDELVRAIYQETPVTKGRVYYQEETTTTSEELRDAESAIQEVQEDNLTGWDIYYTEKMLPDTVSATQVPGTTIAEREQALEDLLFKNSISCSIGSSSVIRALEWLTTVPQEVEQIRIRKRIGGAYFKKLKRGAVRIFYDMDRAKRQLIFFVHQKKDWKYGF